MTARLAACDRWFEIECDLGSCPEAQVMLLRTWQLVASRRPTAPVRAVASRRPTAFSLRLHALIFWRAGGGPDRPKIMHKTTSPSSALSAAAGLEPDSRNLTAELVLWQSSRTPGDRAPPGLLACAAGSWQASPGPWGIAAYHSPPTHCCCPLSSAHSLGQTV